MMKKLWGLSFLVVVLLVAPEANGRRQYSPYVVHRWFDRAGYSETPYTECNDQDGKVSSVEVIPCELEGGACVLHAGTSSTIKINFRSNIGSPTLKAVVHGIVGSIPIPFHIPQSNACQSGVNCPITAASSYSYVAQIPVLKTYPRLSVKVKWELVDNNNKDVTCVIIPAKIR